MFYELDLPGDAEACAEDLCVDNFPPREQPAGIFFELQEARRPNASRWFWML
jgi:hypothetical protein